VIVTRDLVLEPARSSSWQNSSSAQSPTTSPSR
jgi:hypothetical protein